MKGIIGISLCAALLLLSGCTKQVIDIKDKTFCNTETDCTPVSCGCRCSGCGGFDYEDVVNIEYVNQWYEEHQCTKPEICPTVCCPQRRVSCISNHCAVEELDDYS